MFSSNKIFNRLVIIIVYLTIANAGGCSRQALLTKTPNVVVGDPERTKVTLDPYVEQDEERVQSLISSLSSGEEIRLAAERQLIELAQTSSQGREMIINGLLQAIGKRDELDGRRYVLSQEILPFWRSVTRILAEVKASEAVDALLKCIHCGNGYTGSLGEEPASDALWQMGAMSIPKLSKALTEESDPYKRLHIVICLRKIGGPKAKSALKRARRSESNKDLRISIKIALEHIN